MEEQIQKLMWDIDMKAQLGDNITQQEKDFFNAHFEEMKQLMLDNWRHWQFHSGLIH